MGNIIGSRYEKHSDSYTELFLRLTAISFVDCVLIGKRREARLSKSGKEWGADHHVWEKIKQLTIWLHEWQFANLCDLLGIEKEILRRRLLEWMSGQNFTGRATRCTKCGFVGDVYEHFGTRTINDRIYRQSQCKLCRHGKVR